jgi:hypothetical protein
MDCGMVHLTEYERKPSPPPLALDGIPEPASVPNRVEQQILDFLEGRTHGEALLHALHDHVLDEPIPERMLSLFRQACRGELEPG